ncbi:MAG: DUF58 domain-containing protein [Anaerolineales bacterium]
MTVPHASRWLLVAVILIGLTGWIFTGLLIYARLAYFGLLVVGGAALWTVFSMNGIRLRRHTRTLRASMGEVFEEHYEVKEDAWPGCAWLEVLNQSSLPKAAGSRLLTRIGAHQLRYYTARTLLTKRGAYLLGPTTLTSGDPFGLFTRHKTVTARDTLIILPMTFPIPAFPPPPGLLPGGKAIRQRTFDVTPHAAEVRDYIPGDPMKRIHWPSTAHRGQFMVKEFEQDPQADIWLFLDAYRPVHYSMPGTEMPDLGEHLWLRRPKISLPGDTFEYGVSAAASLARFFLADRRAVGLACPAARFTVVPAERGDRQTNKIMETLALLQPDGSIPLIGLVNLQAKLLPLGSGVILITPSAHPDLLLAVEDLQRRNLRPVVVLLKPETFGGPVGTEKVAAGLLSRNIPVCQVGLGDDLGTQLALPAVYFQRAFTAKSYFSSGR